MIKDNVHLAVIIQFHIHTHTVKHTHLWSVSFTFNSSIQALKQYTKKKHRINNFHQSVHKNSPQYVLFPSFFSSKHLPQYLNTLTHTHWLVLPSSCFLILHSISHQVYYKSFIMYSNLLTWIYRWRYCMQLFLMFLVLMLDTG